MRRPMPRHLSSSLQPLRVRAAQAVNRALPLLVVALFATPQATLAFSGDPLHPLGSDTTVELIVGRVITVILGLLGSLSLVMFIFGGLTWMTAQGNEEKIKKAKNTIVYAVLGLIIAFGAYEILRVFFNELLAPALRTTPSA
ncbi:MAG TPA: pilin [Patescibacteria group bacterium]|nr:pilin [Patescibacteria group bacterium]